MKTHPNACIESLELRLAPAGIVAVDTFNQLHLFDSATPGTVTTVAITGLSAPGTEFIMGIDYRPATGELYALGIKIVAGLDNDEGRIYTIDPVTGVATQVGAAPFFSTFADNNDYAFEVDPTTDRLRVISDRDNNIRVNPNDGSLDVADTDLNPNPAIVSVAYTNNFAGAATTTLFGIDRATNSLVTINPPNNGTVVNVGALGFGITGFKVGFDIEARTGNAFAVLTPFAAATGLYTINLATGAATLVGTIQGDPSLQGMTVALPAPAVDIVNNTTATYIDGDGDKVTIQITGAPAGAAFSPDDFLFSVGQFGSQLVLNLSDDGQEWAKANITINAVPVGAMGDSFVNVSFINAAGVDLGKVMVNGDLGRIDSGLTGNMIPGLASLTVQSFGVFNTTTQTSTIVGKLGGLIVKSDFGNALVNVTDTDGSITSVTIAGNLDGRTATGPTGITASQALGNIVINGSVFGGSIANTAGFDANALGSLTIGGSLFGGSADFAGSFISQGAMGNVLVKGSIFGGTQTAAGSIFSVGNMGSVTIKGSLVGGAVVDPGTDHSAGRVVTSANMGAVIIGGDLVGGTGLVGGNLTAVGSMKSVTIGGSIRGDSGNFSGSIQADNGLGNVTVTGDVIGGVGTFSGTFFGQGSGNIANVTIGGSLIGGGIHSNRQLGVVKITGEVTDSSITAVGGTGSPAALLGIKSLAIGLGVENSVILSGYDINANATNANATLGPVTIGGNFVASDMKAGAMATIVITGNLDGRGATGEAGISAVQSIGTVVINGSVFGGSVLNAGRISAGTSFGNLTVGGSIFGGTFDDTGYIQATTLMGNVLVKGSILGGTQLNTGFVAGLGGMGNVTIKGSIVSGNVVDGGTDNYSGCLYTDGNMDALIIGGSLIGGAGGYSGNVFANGTIKSVSIGGSLQGGAGGVSGGIAAGALGNVTVAGDLLGGAGQISGSISTNSGSIGAVTIGGSVIGAGHHLTGILSENQLGAVKIAGEVSNSRISAEGGTGSPAALLAIKSLSIGLAVENSQILAGYDTLDAASNTTATLGPVTIGGNFVTSDMKAGAMAGITIKGNLDGRGAAAASGIFSLGAMGNLFIGGNLFGGGVAEAGKVDANGAVGTVTVGGSIFGGTAPQAGNIEAGTTMGNVLVKGSIFGGTDDHTGNIFANGNMGNVTIKGSIVGGVVVNPANDVDSGLVYSFANIGAVVIGGDLIGSNGSFSGSINGEGVIKSVVVNGSMRGGSGSQSGNIEGGLGIGNVTILGDLIGGSGDWSGSIYTWSNTGSIGDVTIGGSLIGGQTLTGIISNNLLGAVKIGGGMVGGRISAEGTVDVATAAIKSVAITGTVQNALILGGYSVLGAATNPDAAIGAVTVGGNWIASSIAAGVGAGGDTSFGTADDEKIGEMVADTLFSSIASVTIKGYASGAGGLFGITAEKVGAIKVGLQTFNLAAGTDTTGFLIGTSGTFRVKEV